MKIEKDKARVTAGVRHGLTLGGPIALQVENGIMQTGKSVCRRGRCPRERRSPRSTCRDPDTPTWWEPEVQAERRPQHPRAGLRARDRRARCGRRPVQGVPGRARRAGALARDPDRLRACPRSRRSAGLGRLRRGRRVTGALPGRRGRTRRWSRRSTPCARPTSHSVASLRCSAFGVVPGLGSHVSWEERLDGRLAMAILLDPSDEGRLRRRRFSHRRCARLASAR